jgi:hypothetical protein
MPNVGVPISELTELSALTNDDLLLVLDRIGDYYYNRKITMANFKTSLSGDYVTLADIQTITGTKTFSDVNINGTLWATSAVFITTENLAVSSNYLTLNANATGTPTENASINVNRGDYPSAQLLWDESVSAWFYGVSGNLTQIVGTGTTISEKAVPFAAADGTLTESVSSISYDQTSGIFSVENILVDTINERSTNSGVIIENILLKDGAIDGILTVEDDSNILSRQLVLKNTTGSNFETAGIDLHDSDGLAFVLEYQRNDTDDGAFSLYQERYAPTAQPIWRSHMADKRTEFWGNVLPAITNTYSLGTSALQWNDLFVSSGSVYFDNQKLTVDGDGNVKVNDVNLLSRTDTNIDYLSGKIDDNFLSASTNASNIISLQSSLGSLNTVTIPTIENEIAYLSGQIKATDLEVPPYPLSGSYSIELENGSGAYEVVLSGNTEFFTQGEEAGKVKYATTIVSAAYYTDVSAIFHPSWYWVGTRPAGNLVAITSGDMIELNVRSSGTKIIATYDNLV